jgi:hypothetical protein
MTDLNKKKELILERELAFANAISAAVFEKPKVSFWMVLIPFLFLYFLYGMQKYKSGRMKFDADFMVTRRRALDMAAEALDAQRQPDVIGTIRQYGLTDDLEKPYAAWIDVLIDHYSDLLTAEGDNYETLVRKAYHTRINYLESLNHLNLVEKEFYAAIKHNLVATDSAVDIIATIESESHRLRQDLADQVFPENVKPNDNPMAKPFTKRVGREYTS